MKDSVELEVEITECAFHQKDKYFISVFLESPKPSSTLDEPGYVDSGNSKKEGFKMLLKTEEMAEETSEPHFLNNKFAYKVPCVLSASSQSSLSKELLVFVLNFKVCSVSYDYEIKKTGRTETLRGMGNLKSSEELSFKLLDKREITKTVYIYNQEIGDELLGSIECKLSLNTIRDTGHSKVREEEEDINSNIVDSTIQVKKRGSELKLTKLVNELKQSSQIHLDMLKEANQFTNQNFSEYIHQATEDIKSKRVLIDKLLLESNEKNEIIFTFKKTLKKEREDMQELRKENEEKTEMLEQMKQKLKALESSNSSYNEIQKLKKQNISLLKRQKHLKQLENAHKEQATVLHQLQKKAKYAKHYKKLTIKQEEVIKKLERILKQQYQKKNEGNSHPEKKRSERRMKMPPLSKGVYLRYRKQIEDMQDEIKMKTERVQTLAEVLEIKDNQIEQLKKEIKAVTVKSAKEISTLRIKLAKAGIPLDSVLSDVVFVNENDSGEKPYLTFNEDNDLIINQPEQHIQDREKIRRKSIKKTTGRKTSSSGKIGKRKDSLEIQESPSRISPRAFKINAVPNNISIPPLKLRNDNVSELGSEYDGISLPSLSVKNSTFSTKNFRVGNEVQM